MFKEDNLEPTHKELLPITSENKELKSTWIPDKDDIHKGYYSRNDDISVLGLPTRLDNALKNGGLVKVGWFYDCSTDDLFKLRNLGPKTLIYLNEVKNNIYLIDNNVTSNTTKTIIPPIVSEPEVPNEFLINRLLERCKDSRMTDVIKRRYGLNTGETETLEEIGKSYGITRERVRQIQIKSLKKLRHSSVIEKKPILEIVNDMLWKNDGIVSAEEADKLMPTIFKDLSYDGSSILDLITDLGWIQTNRVGDVILYSPEFKEFSLSSLMSEVAKFLEQDKNLHYAKSIAANLLSKDFIDMDRLILLVFRCCKLDPRIDEKISGKFTIYSGNFTKINVWISIISEILKDAKRPLHWEEISRRTNERLVNSGNQVDQRRIHFILIDNPEFALSGRKGRYGLVDWGLRKDSTLDLVTEVLKNSGSPLSWREIYKYVHKYKDTKPANIMAILNNKNRFIHRSDGYWFK